VSTPVEFGVLRDASGYSTHRQTTSSDSSTWHIPKYHAIHPDFPTGTVTACGRPAAEFTSEPVERIDERRRCQRPGCRERWPS